MGTLSFAAAMFLAPLVYRFLLKYRLGKQIKKEGAPVFQALHQKKEGTPTMGGIIIWIAILIVAFIIFVLAKIFNGFWEYLNFINRRETYLPLASFILAAFIGLFDDLLGIFTPLERRYDGGSNSVRNSLNSKGNFLTGFKNKGKGDGLAMGRKIILYAIVAGLGAWWFYFKLERTDLYIPFLGSIFIGPWYLLLFVFIIIATAFSSNETDGLDGLAAGILLIGYASLGAVAFVTGLYNLAAFTTVVIGALLAFLWHNIYPAKFFMGDVGSMSLGVTLGIIAMLTNTVILLPFFAFILVVESLSVIAQLASKKILKKKLFISTPIHHHFEAKGWPETQVTMRFWIVGAVMAVFGLIIFFMDKFI